MRSSAKRFQHILIGLLAVLSLFASPAGACVCSHGDEHIADTVPHGDDVNETSCGFESAADHLLPDDECECLQATPRIAAKYEVLQVDGQAAALPSRVARPTPVIIRSLSAKSAEAELVDRSKLLYFSKSSRGPPLS